MAWSNRQSPAGDNVFLDHVGWFVRSLDAVKPAFERLGFIVSTVNVHMNRAPDGSQAPSGTRNRLATPGLGYLEFLAASGDTPIARQHGAQLARYEGLHLAAFSSADVPGEYPRLQDAGFDPLQPVDMRRTVVTEAGPQEGRFSVLRVSPEAMPEGRVQWCAHHTPDLVWQPGQTAQPNGVEALTGVVWVVDDLDEALARYSRFVRKPSLRSSPDTGVVRLERGQLIFATRKGADALLPGLAIPTVPFGAAVSLRVGSLAKTAAVLAANGVAATPIGTMLRIAPADALGVTLLLHEGDAPSFN